MIKENMFVSGLLDWHKLQPVSFPWRETNDPFKILVSELLLRKTTRKQVSSLYRQFFSTYPTFEALNSSSIDSIKKVITPLGMEHIRAVALKEIAKTILYEHGGNVPRQKEQLLSLPHVGPYIANAVLCFAFGEDAPLLDTNAIRVIIRVFSFKPKKKRAREDVKMWEIVAGMIPKGRSRDFNLSILDFASSICTSKNPKCLICQMLTICDYGQALSKLTRNGRRN